MGDGFNRRQVLGALGAGVTGSLAGCKQALEPDEDDQTDGQTDNQGNEPLDIRIAQAEDANLSNVDPSSTEPKTYGLPFSADAAKADANVRIEVTNGVQTQVYEASTDELEVVGDNVSILNLPENMLVHGDTQISATFTDENQEGTLTTEMSAQTPPAFPIDRRVEGEQTSNFQTEWSFAQHDLDREEARQAHLNYVNNEFVWDYDTSNSEYSEAFDEIASLNPNQEMETILTRAGNIASDIDGKRSPGTTQSGLEVGFTTSEIARKVNDDIGDDRLRTINVKNPENSQDQVVQVDMATGTLYSQAVNKVTDALDEPVVYELNPSNFNDNQFNSSTIFGFEPGEVEGIDYDNKSKSAVTALTSPSRTTDTNSSTISINDYAIEIISQEHLFGEEDMQEAFDTLASVNRVEEIVNYDINGEPVYDSPPGDSLGDMEGAMYIGLAADQGDSLENMTLFVTEDESVYREMTHNPEPVSRQEIETMAELN